MSIKDIAIETLHPVIEELNRRLPSIFGEQFVGLYIHGSIAMDVYVPDRSDIDFLVVTHDEVDDVHFEALKQMHAEIYDSGLYGAKILEGSYISKRAIRTYDPENCQHTALRCDGVLACDGHDVDWIIQRFVLLNKGIVISGPQLNTLIDPISDHELKQAAYGILDNWWRPQLTNHSNLAEDEYQAYAVLTMCRSFYTIQMGDVVPKITAANWFCDEFPEWRSLVEKALIWRKGLAFNALEDTLDLIRFALEKTKVLLNLSVGD